MVKNIETGSVRSFEKFEGQELDIPVIIKILKSYEIITFNGNNYDIPLLFAALFKAPCGLLKQISDLIIKENKRPWEITEQFGYQIKPINHIDLIEVAIGQCSLKIYGGRIHSQKLQDLPIDPEAEISPTQREELKFYCQNDLQTTIDLYNKLKPQLDLRVKMTARYGIDLRSKSDAQIAEAIFKREVEKATGKPLYRPKLPKNYSFKYSPPSYLPQNRLLEDICAEDFTLNDVGYVVMPESLDKRKIQIGKSVYRLGIGGLHSSEETVSYQADKDHFLVDRDAASFYPKVISNNGYYPSHIGLLFLDIYNRMIKERLDAKHSGDKVTSDIFKIMLNGSFGKFGSKWSCLYSPNLLIHTTLTGQLSLLMLIDMLERKDFHVVSANTDGIVVYGRRDRKYEMDDIFAEWEKLTNFVTEETEYVGVYSRDVNNYFAVKTDGKVKTKGAYADEGLAKNPKNNICNIAVSNFLSKGKKIETTIYDCRDIRKFVTIRKVTGGAEKDGVYLGRAVRWYYSKDSAGCITYIKNGNKVPESEGGKPLMELPSELPQDIDYDYYINEARSILKQVGYKGE